MELSKEEDVGSTDESVQKYLSKENQDLLIKFDNRLKQIKNFDIKKLLSIASVAYIKYNKERGLKSNEINYSILIDILGFNYDKLIDFIIANDPQLTEDVIYTLLSGEFGDQVKDGENNYMHNSINYAMENYSVIKLRDDCSDCITPCLNYYRYSSLWYSYYYDVYYDCVYTHDVMNWPVASN